MQRLPLPGHLGGYHHPQWIYDRCDMIKPPPYFPTTGRYFKNRYYEIDPVGFTVAGWFAANQ